MKFPTDSKGNVVVEWDKQNERYQWTRDITHEFIVFPPSCNSYVTIYPPNDTPKSDLPPGAVRLDSLKWDDIFSLSDIIDPYTLRVVVHRRCCPEGDSRPFSHKYQGTTYDLTGHDPSTPVYPVEASFTLKGEPVTFPSCWTEDRVAPGPPHYVAGHAQAEAPHNPVGQAQMNAPAPEPKVDPESAALNRWEEYAAARGGKPHPPK